MFDSHSLGHTEKKLIVGKAFVVVQVITSCHNFLTKKRLSTFAWPHDFDQWGMTMLEKIGLLVSFKMLTQSNLHSENISVARLTLDIKMKLCHLVKKVGLTFII